MNQMIVLALVVIIVVAVGIFVTRGRSAGGQYSDPAELAALLSSNRTDYVLVDVRTAEEYSSGHIPGAVNIPYDVIDRNLPTRNKGDLVVLYCRSGNRSGQAERTLGGLGYTNLVNFGGVGRWNKDLVRGSQPK